MVAKMDGSNTTAESSYRKAENLEKKITPFEEQLGALNQSYEALSQATTRAKQKNAKQHHHTVEDDRFGSQTQRHRSNPGNAENQNLRV